MLALLFAPSGTKSPHAIIPVLGCSQPVALALGLQHPLGLQFFASSFLNYQEMSWSLLTKDS